MGRGRAIQDRELDIGVKKVRGLSSLLEPLDALAKLNRRIARVVVAGRSLNWALGATRCIGQTRREKRGGRGQTDWSSSGDPM